MRQLLVAIACWALAAAHAATVNAEGHARFVGIGGYQNATLVLHAPGPGYNVAMWGPEASGPASDALVATLEPLLNAAVARLPDANFRFSYDTQAAPIQPPYGDRAEFPVTRLDLRWSGPEGSLAVTSSTATADVARGTPSRIMDVHVGPLALSADGPFLDDADPAEFTLDLAALLASHGQGLAWPLAVPLPALPVRMRLPEAYAMDQVSVELRRMRQADDTGPLALPASLGEEYVDSSIGGDSWLSMYMHGEASLRVDPSDYADAPSFEQAAAWLAGGVSRLDIEFDGHMVIDDLRSTVQAVPEPETWALMLAGLALVPAAARRRRVNARA